VGGMFGVRGELYPEDFLIPWAAQVVGRPVKWIEDRREHLLAINHAREMRVDLALALDAEGRFLGMRAHAVVDMGAYTRPLGARIPLLAIEELPGPYRWPAFGAVAEGWATTKTPVGTVRAPVALEGTFARERAIDMAAARLGIDPLEVRRRNLIAPDELPFTRRYGPGLHDQRYDSGDFPAMLDGLLACARHPELVAERDARRRRGELAGVGVGLFLAHSGLGEEERVSATLVDGELLVQSAAAEMGQGLDRVIRLVAAEAWGADPLPVRVVSGTTIATPPSRGTFASRSVIFVGSAVRDACHRLLDAAREEAARRLGVAPDAVVREPGGLGDGRGRTIGWAELGPLTAEGQHRDGEFAFGFGGHVALVVVDAETGEPRVERMAVGYDCGRAVDREGVEGQLAGAVAMGVGGSLYEELRYDAEGQPLVTTFMDYLVPTLAEVPPVDVAVFEYPATGNPLGAKGAGEAGVIGVGAAIGNAIADALGRPDRLADLPLRPGRVLAELAAAVAAERAIS
jgi:carbon-monoxide dehydrogenase large subunit